MFQTLIYKRLKIFYLIINWFLFGYINVGLSFPNDYFYYYYNHMKEIIIPRNLTRLL